MMELSETEIISRNFLEKYDSKLKSLDKSNEEKFKKAVRDLVHEAILGNDSKFIISCAEIILGSGKKPFIGFGVNTVDEVTGGVMGLLQEAEVETVN